MRLRESLALFLVALTASASAQRGGAHGSAFSGAFHAEPSVPGTSGVFRSSTQLTGFRADRFRRSSYLYGGFPLWWDAAYDGSSSPTQIYLMQGQPGVQETVNPTPPAPPQDPVLIELRGDRYVRVSSAEPTGGAGNETVRPGPAANASTIASASTIPTVFVFRDGHREESSDYSIYGGVVYARTEYWTDGSWTKQIPLSALNIAESRKVNYDRGVRFTLPSSPNEVVVRP